MSIKFPVKAYQPHPDTGSVLVTDANNDCVFMCDDQHVARELVTLLNERSEAEREWISVKDRLPESAKEVLLYHCIGDVLRTETCTIDVAWYSEHGGWGFPWDRGGLNPAPRWAIAWMPLQAPFRGTSPQEGK